MLDLENTAKEIFQAQQDKRQELVRQAQKFLFDNQECYVAQWIIQNPFERIEDYRLKFVYNDESLLGYTVEMEKIENV